MEIEEIRKRVKEISLLQDKLNIDFQIDIGQMINDLKYLLKENDLLKIKLHEIKGELISVKNRKGNHIPRID